MRRLRPVVLVGDKGRRLWGSNRLDVVRGLQIRHVFRVLAQIGRVVTHEDTLVEDVLWPIEQEPEHDQVDDDGDPDFFAEADPVLASFQVLDDRQQVVGVAVFVAAGPFEARGFGRRAGWRTGWDFSSRH
jgi:hypothetical protein